ncbi:Nucleic acid-binding, OB-fold [Pseudocohnilembus persalinus]|uniref:Nucleic acid-binding, OB-fold n=1 Tax=Pseudocohnilembus persalinus TaxID=266149 RepID=A0A0V0QRN3_PSEPJ|nr:Nucleic acid-binding, OB-fold [Pseudocohnilembus persalinus]|eukprot:KRX04849.1 Nucleic acid-binding, OB-fold [Pseudocohnilembus persalinus]
MKKNSIEFMSSSNILDSIKENKLYLDDTTDESEAQLGFNKQQLSQQMSQNQQENFSQLQKNLQQQIDVQDQLNLSNSNLSQNLCQNANSSQIQECNNGTSQLAQNLQEQQQQVQAQQQQFSQGITLAQKKKFHKKSFSETNFQNQLEQQANSINNNNSNQQNGCNQYFNVFSRPNNIPDDFMKEFLSSQCFNNDPVNNHEKKNNDIIFGQQQTQQDFAQQQIQSQIDLQMQNQNKLQDFTNDQHIKKQNLNIFGQNFDSSLYNFNQDNCGNNYQNNNDNNNQSKFLINKPLSISSDSDNDNDILKDFTGYNLNDKIEQGFGNKKQFLHKFSIDQSERLIQELGINKNDTQMQQFKQILQVNQVNGENNFSELKQDDLQQQNMMFQSKCENQNSNYYSFFTNKQQNDVFYQQNAPQFYNRLQNYQETLEEDNIMQNYKMEVINDDNIQQEKQKNDDKLQNQQNNYNQKDEQQPQQSINKKLINDKQSQLIDQSNQNDNKSEQGQYQIESNKFKEINNINVDYKQICYSNLKSQKDDTISRQNSSISISVQSESVCREQQKSISIKQKSEEQQKSEDNQENEENEENSDRQSQSQYKSQSQSQSQIQDNNAENNENDNKNSQKNSQQNSNNNNTTNNKQKNRKKKKKNNNNSERPKEFGRIKFFDENKNYGFMITLDDENVNIFVHYDDLLKAGVNKELLLKNKDQGNKMVFSFVILKYYGKYKFSKKAVDISIIDENSERYEELQIKLKSLERVKLLQQQQMQNHFPIYNQQNHLRNQFNMGNNNLNFQQPMQQQPQTAGGFGQNNFLLSLNLNNLQQQGNHQNTQNNNIVQPQKIQQQNDLGSLDLLAQLNISKNLNQNKGQECSKDNQQNEQQKNMNNNNNVVPPKNWKPKKNGYEQDLETGMIPKPIEQNAYGKGGIYECLYMVQKSLSMKEYIKRSKKFENITDGKSTEQIEQMFYKHLAFSPPLYGADSRNSLFEPGCPWNLGEIKTLLQDGLKDVIEGVNDPYLYVGVWKTTFAWHKEDLNLGALNYLHYGKPKFWYAIPEEDHHYLEKMSKLYFADNFNKCSEYLRHKTTIISPYLLKKKFPECRINKCVQNAGEFIVVFPGAYHHGFNYGFNIAEAVNYATKNWLPIYLKAGICKCVPDQVKINHRQFYDNLIATNPDYKNDPEIKAFLKKIKELGLYDINYAVSPQQTQEKQKLRKNSKQQIKNNEIEEENLKVNDEKPKQKRNSKKPVEKLKPLPVQKKRIFKTKNNNNTNNKIRNKVGNLSQESEEEDSINSNSSSTALPQNTPQKKRMNKNDKKQNNNNKNNVQKQSKAEDNKSVKKRALNKNKTQKSEEQQLKDKMIVEDWLQCDDCKKWRKIDSTLQNLKRRKQFYCKSLGVKCNQPQAELTYTLAVK